MLLTPALFIAYGTIVFIGSVFGYLKAKSLPSLIAGLVTEAVSVAAALLYHHHPRLSLVIVGVVSQTLEIIMFRRYQATKKVFPALIVFVLSGLVVIYCVIQYVIMFGHRAH